MLCQHLDKAHHVIYNNDKTFIELLMIIVWLIWWVKQFPFLCLMRRKFWALPICYFAHRHAPPFPPQPTNRGIGIHHQEHQKSGAEFGTSSKKHQFLKHQRRGWQQIPKIGEKLEREIKFNIASKTACRGFKSFCPCHWKKVRRCSTAGRLRTFSLSKSRDWTRSVDTG